MKTKAIAGTLLLVVFSGVLYLAINRGWVFAQSSPPSAVCSNATLQGEFALVLLMVNQGMSNNNTLPSFGTNNVFGAASFDGVNTVIVTLTQRIWSAAGQPLVFPGGVNPVSTQTIQSSYEVTPDCTVQFAGSSDLHVQVIPGGPPPWNRTFLLFDSTTASGNFGPSDQPGTLVRNIGTIGMGIKK